ncbi:MAG: NAD(P)/FAD-dependent oxidoreductase [Candidatus Dadabacteria bacterium]|nr:NAD(P)/FAD-dependent oxidoreductase [Candidatus Dadabacteria bacterium]
MTDGPDSRNGLTDERVVIIGGGPAGLTAAYELSRAGRKTIVLEKDDIVGGIARTVNYKGYRFDIGGHRFFTKVKAVEDLWEEVLGADFVERKRLSRIYYNKKFFYYPFKIMNAVFGLGIWNSFMIVVSYLKAQAFPDLPEETFDKWVSNRFGKRLYELFFKTYTEKVWGIPCTEISAEWAAQRIKGLSLLEAMKNALLKNRGRSREDVIKTLIDSFHYPRLGPGMMWEAIAQRITGDGSDLVMNADVCRLRVSGAKVESVTVRHGGGERDVRGSHFISSMPVRELIGAIYPPPPDEVVKAANDLKYRDFLTVSLIIDTPVLCPDNWIYIHDPGVRLGRIQNFKNWSEEMVPDPEKTCLGLEYFCFEGDGLWTMSDRDLIELGKKELGMIGLCDPSLVVDGTVVRMPKAYPVYDSTYRESLATIRGYLSGIDNLQLVGRNGMHKYNNQDHSMLTAMLAARNISGADYDLWRVNTDQEYHEEGEAGDYGLSEYEGLSSTQPRVPESVPRPIEQAIIKAFARLDKLAFALSVGTVSGLAVFMATIFLILKGGTEAYKYVGLLNQYFAGYTISIEGAFMGFGYSFFWGFIFGWLFAYMRNFLTGIFIFKIKRERELSSFKNFIDYI